MNMYVCVCVEGKIAKQMGSTVAYRKLTRVPLRDCLKSFYPCISFKDSFSTQKMVGENHFFLVNF